MELGESPDDNNIAGGGILATEVHRIFESDDNDWSRITLATG
jgi:hypothetical protein